MPFTSSHVSLPEDVWDNVGALFQRCLGALYRQTLWVHRNELLQMTEEIFNRWKKEYEAVHESAGRRLGQRAQDYHASSRASEPRSGR